MNWRDDARAKEVHVSSAVYKLAEALEKYGVPVDFGALYSNRSFYVFQRLEYWKKYAKRKGKAAANSYFGERPRAENYMPSWPKAECTHYQMYESTSEGTPISPVMATPEDLAHWLADTGASAFAHCTATYEQWLVTCQVGSAPSAVLDSKNGVRSGVEAQAEGK